MTLPVIGAALNNAELAAYQDWMRIKRAMSKPRSK